MRSISDIVHLLPLLFFFYCKSGPVICYSSFSMLGCFCVQSKNAYIMKGVLCFMIPLPHKQLDLRCLHQVCLNISVETLN